MEKVAHTNNNEVDVVVLLRALWKAKIFIILFTLLCGAFSVYIALTATEMYRAHTVVMPVQANASGASSALSKQFGGLAGIAGIDLGGSTNSDYLATLNSRSLVESFIENNQLIDVVSGDGTKLSLWFAVREFQEHILSIFEDDGTGSVAVYMEWKDPAVAADWANKFIVLANNTIRNKATTEAEANIQYLNTQIKATNNVELQRVLYNLIESETKTLMLSNVSKNYAFNVIDLAVPPELRSKPKRRLLVMSWLAAGFAFSLFLVFVYHMYRRVVTPDAK